MSIPSVNVNTNESSFTSNTGLPPFANTFPPGINVSISNAADASPPDSNVGAEDNKAFEAEQITEDNKSKWNWETIKKCGAIFGIIVGIALIGVLAYSVGLAAAIPSMLALGIGIGIAVFGQDYLKWFEPKKEESTNP